MKKTYKKNKEYTNEFENIGISQIVYWYKTSDSIDFKNEIILFLLEKYNIYFGNKPRKIGLGEEDTETFLYMLLTESLNKYKLDSNMTFKSYIIQMQNYKISSMTTSKRMKEEQYEKGDIIKVNTFNDFEDGSSFIESISDTSTDIVTDIILEDIKKDLGTMGTKGKMFYDRTYNGMKLKELGTKYGYHLERCRQIVNEVREIIKIKYN